MRMVKPTVYLLDSNIFIQAKNQYYHFDIAPGFWDALKVIADEGSIISIDRVRDELINAKDELAEWVSDNLNGAFHSTRDEAVYKKYQELQAWARDEKQYSQPAIHEFARAENADPWVVAFALAYGCTLVTHESYDPNIRKKIPIPNVGRAFGLKTINTFTMLRQLGVKLN